MAESSNGSPDGLTPKQAHFAKLILQGCTGIQAYYKMGWVYGARYDRENRIHPDLVPYAQLGQLEQDKDAVFVMLCEIARQWIYDLPEQADV